MPACFPELNFQDLHEHAPSSFLKMGLRYFEVQVGVRGDWARASAASGHGALRIMCGATYTSAERMRAIGASCMPPWLRRADLSHASVTTRSRRHITQSSSDFPGCVLWRFWSHRAGDSRQVRRTPAGHRHKQHDDGNLANERVANHTGADTLALTEEGPAGANRTSENGDCCQQPSRSATCEPSSACFGSSSSAAALASTPRPLSRCVSTGSWSRMASWMSARTAQTKATSTSLGRADLSFLERMGADSVVARLRSWSFWELVGSSGT